MGICVYRLSIFRTEHLHRYEEGSKLTGILYIHRISDNRFGGITGRNFNLFRRICGESILKNTVLVTNMWKEDSQVVNKAREKELSSRFFKPALDQGAKMVPHHNTTKSAHDILRRVVKNQPAVLQVQQELVDERKDIIDTMAGDFINKKLKEQIKRYQAELKELREEMKEALKAKDEEMRQELEETERALEESIMRTKKDSEGMAVSYAEQKEMVTTKMREKEQEMEKPPDHITIPVY